MARQSALDKQLEALLALKEQAKAKGLVALAPIVAVAVEESESHDDAPASNPRTLVLNAVTAYHEAIKKLPRQLLEARYLKDVGEKAPSVAREWLIEKMARKMQRETYLQYEGEVPASVLRNDRIFAMNRPRVLEFDEETGESDEDDSEPNKSERKFDPTMRARALIECPFSRGRSMVLFQTVASQPQGIQYNGLVLMLKTIFDWAQAKAEAKAQKVFTQWVDKGWVELI